MKTDGRKIANSFYFPKHPSLRGIASLMDFTGELDRDIVDQLRNRSDADALRADWEAVGDYMRWAFKEYDKELREKIAHEQ